MGYHGRRGRPSLIDSTTNWIANAYNRDSVYDTWTTTYDGTVQFQDAAGDLLHYNNGIDDYVYDPNDTNAETSPLDNSYTDGIIDGNVERETRPPYGFGVSLPAIRVTIRVYQPTHPANTRTHHSAGFLVA